VVYKTQQPTYDVTKSQLTTQSARR